MEGENMKKKIIATYVGDTTELLAETKEFIEKVGHLLEDERFNNEEGQCIIELLYQVLGENGNKMERYLVNDLTLRLTKTSLDQEKIRWLNEQLMEVVAC